jgi:hypothetical protein
MVVVVAAIGNENGLGSMGFRAGVGKDIIGVASFDNSHANFPPRSPDGRSDTSRRLAPRPRR